MNDNKSEYQRFQRDFPQESLTVSSIKRNEEIISIRIVSTDFSEGCSWLQRDFFVDESGVWHEYFMDSDGRKWRCLFIDFEEPEHPSRNPEAAAFIKQYLELFRNNSIPKEITEKLEEYIFSLEA